MILSVLEALVNFGFRRFMLFLTLEALVLPAHCQLATDSFPHIKVDQFDRKTAFVFSNSAGMFLAQGKIIYMHLKDGKYLQRDLLESLPREIRKDIDLRYSFNYYFRNDSLAIQK